MRPVNPKQKLKSAIICYNCGKRNPESHHPLTYRNKQIDEITVMLCSYCHRGNNGCIWQDVREKCELKALRDNIVYLKQKYPKRDWQQRLNYLNSKVW